MESERSPERDALSDVHTIRARAAGMPRGHAVLQLAYTILIAAYMGVFVFTGSTEGGSSVFGNSTMALVLPPMIISTGLISGANERFVARQRTTKRQWKAVGFFLVALLVVLIWGIAGDGYPWWLSFIYAGVTLVIFGARPMGVLLRKQKMTREVVAKSHLSRPVRVVTMLIGVFLGLVCALVLVPASAWYVVTIGMLGIIVALSAQTSKWGLLRTGYEWRFAQWTGFGIAAAIMLALAVLVIATNVVTPVVAISAGTVVTITMGLSALVPGSARGTPAA